MLGSDFFSISHNTCVCSLQKFTPITFTTEQQSAMLIQDYKITNLINNKKNALRRGSTHTGVLCAYHIFIFRLLI